MSRFVYKVYIEDKHIADCTSVNDIINTLRLEHDYYMPLIKAFKIPPFTKRLPQVYEDNRINLKVESDYIVKDGKLPSPWM